MKLGHFGTSIYDLKTDTLEVVANPGKLEKIIIYIKKKIKKKKSEENYIEFFFYYFTIIK